MAKSGSLFRCKSVSETLRSLIYSKSDSKCLLYRRYGHRDVRQQGEQENVAVVRSGDSLTFRWTGLLEPQGPGAAAHRHVCTTNSPARFSSTNGWNGS